MGFCPLSGIPGVRVYNQAVVDLLESAMKEHKARVTHRTVLEALRATVADIGIKEKFDKLTSSLGVKKISDLEYVTEKDLKPIIDGLSAVDERKLLAALKALHDEL